MARRSGWSYSDREVMERCWSFAKKIVAVDQRRQQIVAQWIPEKDQLRQKLVNTITGRGRRNADIDAHNQWIAQEVGQLDRRRAQLIDHYIHAARQAHGTPNYDDYGALGYCHDAVLSGRAATVAQAMAMYQQQVQMDRIEANQRRIMQNQRNLSAQRSRQHQQQMTANAINGQFIENAVRDIGRRR